MYPLFLEYVISCKVLHRFDQKVGAFLDVLATGLESKQYWPGSRLGRPILSSAPRRGGEDPPVYWQAGGGDLYI
jgi:hypothetical protein